MLTFCVVVDAAQHVQVLVELLADPLHLAQESLVSGQFLQLFLADLAQHAHRVVLVLFPQVAVHGDEQLDGLGIPGQPQVGGNGQQRLQFFRQIGNDLEFFKIVHGLTLLQRYGAEHPGHSRERILSFFKFR